MTNPMYKWQPRPMSRFQLQEFLRANLETIKAEKAAGVIGPATQRFRKLASRIPPDNSISGGDGHVTVGPPPGGER